MRYGCGRRLFGIKSSEMKMLLLILVVSNFSFPDFEDVEKSIRSCSENQVLERGQSLVNQSADR